MDALDEDICRKLKTMRLSLQISAINHDKRSSKSKTLLKAIDDFLGDRPNGTKPAPQQYGQLSDAVRSVIFAMDEKQFTVENVETALAAIKNDAPAADRQGISVALWKMADRGELEIVERGAGRKPTIYKALELQIVRHRRT